MSQPVTPYIWNYQPETGLTSGAQQDYGSVINWLRADPMLCSRIRNVNTARNNYLRSMKRDVAYARAGKRQEKAMKARDKLRSQMLLDEFYTSEGQQLAGGYALGDGRQYRKLTRDNLPFPHNWQVFENGRWRPISGGSANALSSYPFVMDEALSGRGQPVSVSGDGLSPLAFARAYPPLVYNAPFSGAVEYFPREFSPLYDPSRAYRPSRVNDLYQ